MINDGAIDLLISEAAEAAQYIWEKGWAESNAGNISINITERFNGAEKLTGDYPVHDLNGVYKELAGAYFWVTAAGSRMRGIARDPDHNSLLIQISALGDAFAILKPGNDNGLKPTSELPSHLITHRLIARRKSREKVVIHTHPNELIALTHIPELIDDETISRALWSMHPETPIFVPEGIGLVRYMKPGSQGLAEATLDKLKNYKIVIWEKHGCFAIGDAPMEIFDKIDILVKSAQIYFLCRSAGLVPSGLNDKDIEELRQFLSDR